MEKVNDDQQIKVREHVALLNLMDVENAYKIIMGALQVLVDHSVKKVTKNEIENWVKALDEHSKSGYEYYQDHDFTHTFLIWKFANLTSRTILRGAYARQQMQTGSTIELLNKTIEQAREKIGRQTLSGVFSDGVEYLGELAGAWVLTCPEENIRSDRDCKKIIADYRAKKIGTPYEAHLHKSSTLSSSRVEREVELIFALDYKMYQYTDLFLH